MGGFVSRIVSKPVSPVVQKEAVKAAPKGPTVADMDQRRLGVARRGRRATILTSSKGVDEDLTLSTKTLLG